MIAAINASDLTALSNMLYFYEQYLSKTIAPSTKRTRDIAEVKLLRTKIQQLASSQAAILTFEEVSHIDAAISIFTSQIRQKIPQSKNRNEVIERSELLREYLVKNLTPSEKKTDG